MATQTDVQPYVKEFRDTLAAVQREYDEAVAAAQREFVTGTRGAARAEGERAFMTRERLLSDLADAKRMVARAQLAMQDRFAGWMVVHAASYPDHVQIVMDALPVTVPQVREISRNHGWCDEFNRLLRMAIQAGVIDDGRPAVRREFDDWMRSNFSVRESWMDQMNDRLDAIVADAVGTAVTAAVAQCDAAHAEAVRAMQQENKPKAAAKKAAKVQPVDVPSGELVTA